MQTVLMVLVMATRHCCLRLILGGFKQQKAKTEKIVFMPKAKKKKNVLPNNCICGTALKDQ